MQSRTFPVCLCDFLQVCKCASSDHCLALMHIIVMDTAHSQKSRQNLESIFGTKHLDFSWVLDAMSALPPWGSITLPRSPAPGARRDRPETLGKVNQAKPAGDRGAPLQRRPTFYHSTVCEIFERWCIRVLYKCHCIDQYSA